MISQTKIQCEVLVVGAGSAGVSAAVSAAGTGADVLLIEKSNEWGGIARKGMNNFICGLYANGKNVPRTTLNNGIAREICSRLKKIDPTKTVTRIGKVYALPFQTKDLMTVFNSLAKKEKHLKILNGRAVAVRAAGNIIQEVSVKDPQKSYTVVPKVVIDCSGEGDIIRLSAAGHRLSKRVDRQLLGYSFRVKGVRNAGEMTAVKVPYLVQKAIEEKKLPLYLKYTTISFIKGTNEGIIKLSVSPADGEPDIDRIKSDARKVQEYLTAEIPALKRTRITEMSPEVLEREGIRMMGEYILEADDVIEGRKFSDGVVKSTWPIEFWDRKKGPQYRYLRSGSYYEIPARSLKSKAVTNLYSAGRCISVTQEALASTRVMGTCFSLGEQAGLAAAESVIRNR